MYIYRVNPTTQIVLHTHMYVYIQQCTYIFIYTHIYRTGNGARKAGSKTSLKALSREHATATSARVTASPTRKVWFSRCALSTARARARSSCACRNKTCQGLKVPCAPK